MELLVGTFLVGCTDDIAAVVLAGNMGSAQIKLNQVMRRVTAWLEEHRLDLATEKTEIVLLTTNRIPSVYQYMWAHRR